MNPNQPTDENSKWMKAAFSELATQHEQRSAELTSGSNVIIKDLARKPEYNGLHGTVREIIFDRAKVVLHGGTLLSLKLENLHVVDTRDFSQGSRVTVVRVKVQGLSSAAQYNGCIGTRGNCLKDGRVQVTLDKEKKELSLKPVNIEAVGGPALEGRLTGLDTRMQSRAEDSLGQRWIVRFPDSDGGKELSLPRSNITFVQLRPGDVVPPHPSEFWLQWTTGDPTNSAGLNCCKLLSTKVFSEGLMCRVFFAKPVLQSPNLC